MPKLPSVSAAKTIRALNKIGFQKISQRGGHIKLQRQQSGITEIVVVPNHKAIKKGTLRNGILKPIDLSVDDFIKLLK